MATDQLIIEYYGVDGYARKTYLRQIPWSYLPESLQQEWVYLDCVYATFNLTEGQEAPNQLNYGRTEIHALVEGIPWRTLELWDNEGLVIHSDLFHIARDSYNQKLKSERLARTELRKAEEARLNAEIEEHLAFVTELELAANKATWRKAQLTVTLKDDKTDKETQEIWDGYEIIFKDSGLTTGFFINKARKYWQISHMNTGGALDFPCIGVRNDAMGLVVLLCEIWPDWVTMKDAVEIENWKAISKLKNKWQKYLDY